MISNADIRPGDVASGTGLAVAIVAATVFAYLHVDPPAIPPLTQAVRIRAVSPAAFEAAGTSQASAGAPQIATTAPARASRRDRRRASSRSRRSAAALPEVAPEPATEPPSDASEAPEELPSLGADDPLPPADTDDIPTPFAEAPGDGPSDAPAVDSEGDDHGDGGLAEMAISAYRSRLVAWMASQFQVRGTGLAKSQLARLRGRAQIQLDEARTVVDFQYTSSGNAAFDTAAIATLEGLRGKTVPNPPEAFPGALQRTISVTFVCKASTCD